LLVTSWDMFFPPALFGISSFAHHVSMFYNPFLFHLLPESPFYPSFKGTPPPCCILIKYNGPKVGALYASPPALTTRSNSAKFDPFTCSPPSERSETLRTPGLTAYRYLPPPPPLSKGLLSPFLSFSHTYHRSLSPEPVARFSR